jgi:cytidyltransferase-like protein
MAKQTKKKPIVIVSGYFNPIHKGHIKMIEAASNLGHVWVIVNTDAQVKLKGSIPFMDQEERIYIIQALKNVDYCSLADDTDKTVRKSLKEIRNIWPDRRIIFANGGDRKDWKDIPESATCDELKIEMIFNVGGEKSQSSSTLIKEASKLTK